MRLPGLGPKTARRIWQELGITTVDGAAGGRRGRAAPRDTRASAPARRRRSPRRSPTGRRRRPERSRALLGTALPQLHAVVEELRSPPRVGRGLARRLGAAHARDRPRPRHHRDGHRPGGARRPLLHAAVGGRGGGEGDDEGDRRVARRAALRPPGRPAGELRQPAAALHRLEEPQRRAARGRRPPRPLRVRVRDHRGRDGRGAPLRDRGGGVPRSSATTGSRPSCARTAASWRLRAPARCRRSSSSATCAATCTRTRPGPTGRTRSRRWSRRRAGAATPTTRSATTRSACAAICFTSSRRRSTR